MNIFTTVPIFYWCNYYFRQSCEMSYLLHGANLSNQILPHKNCINYVKFSIQIEWNWDRWLIPSNIFTQVYLPFWHLWHLWHFATLISDEIFWGYLLPTGQCPVSRWMFIWGTSWIHPNAKERFTIEFKLIVSIQASCSKDMNRI